jgi:hypothetical protein
MKKSRMFQVFACLAIVVFFVCGQQAQAQQRLQFRVAPGPHADKAPRKGVKEKAVLEQLSSGFGTLPPLDENGNDVWPCFPNMNSNGMDCSSIPTGGVVIGEPAYTWSLRACDGHTATSANCGQVFSFFEDDTGDNTNYIVTSVVAKQGADYILNTGPVNLGLDPFSPGTVLVIYLDTAFGTLGQTGPGNGFCAGSTETCVNPKAGEATFTFIVTVGPSTITSTFKVFLD